MAAVCSKPELATRDASCLWSSAAIDSISRRHSAILPCGCDSAGSIRMPMICFRRVLSLTLVLLSLCSGTPLPVCRCSNGDIRLFCPMRVHGSGKSECADCCSETACCCGKLADSSPIRTTDADDLAQFGSASACGCSSLTLQPANRILANKVCVPGPLQFDQLLPSSSEARLSEGSSQGTIESVPPHNLPPPDLLVLFQRWLI